MKVEIRRHGVVGEIVFANPPLNHATVAMLAAIADALEELDRDSAIRAVVLSAEGKVFCAGADLAQREGGGVGGSGDDPVKEFYETGLRLFATAKPVVTAIQGAAIGAGLGLAVVSDFRVASSDARFAANFTRLGYHPGFGLTHTLPRLVGAQKASLLFLTSRRLKPDEALAMGLVDEVVPPAALAEAAHRLAGEIAENAPLGLLTTRRTLRRGLVEEVAAAMERERAEQARLRDTSDYAEGVRSANERRPARFIGA